MADPLLFSLVQDLEFQTGYRIKQVVATRADILESIPAGYPDKALVEVSAGDVGDSRRRPHVPSVRRCGADARNGAGAPPRR